MAAALSEARSKLAHLRATIVHALDSPCVAAPDQPDGGELLRFPAGGAGWAFYPRTYAAAFDFFVSQFRLSLDAHDPANAFLTFVLFQGGFPWDADQGRDGPAPSVALVGDPGSGKTFAAHTAAALLPSGMVKWANHVTDMNAPANGLVTVMDEAPCGWNEVSDAAPEHVNCFVTKDPTNVLSSEQLAHSIFVRMRRGTSLAEVERIGNSDLPGGPVPGFADDVRHLFFRRRQLDVAQYLGLVEQPALDADVVDALQRWQDAHGPLADYARVKAKAVHAARCMKNFLTVVLEFGHCANARAGRFTMAHLQRCGRTQPMEDELCDILVAACVF